MVISRKNCFRVAASAFLLFLSIYYWKPISGMLVSVIDSLTPIAIGIAMAYILNILMCFYEKHYFKKYSKRRFVQKTRRPLCLVAAMITLAAAMVLLTLLVIPELLSCIKFIINEIPPAIERFLSIEWINNILPKDIISKLSGIDWESHITKFLQNLGTGIDMAFNAVVNVISSVMTAAITAVISIIFSIYLLFGKERLQANSKRVLHRFAKPSLEDKLLHALSVINECFRKYIIGQFIEAVILGVLCALGMMLLRIPYAGMIGALVGFTALIPIAGAYIGAVVGAVMILTVSPMKAVFFLIFIIILQQIEGNLIYPKVVGSSIGLPAIFVLLAVTVGGSLGGVLGMIIGVPFAAAAYRLLREEIERWEALNNVKES